jgi:hypothetical protein
MCIFFGLIVASCFADISAIWNGFEGGNVENYAQTAYICPVLSNVTIGTSADVAHCGAVSLKVENFTLASLSTTTSQIGVADNGGTVWGWHVCVNYNTLFIWAYIPTASWIPDLIGQYTVDIDGSVPRYYGPEVTLTPGWNYLSFDLASARAAVGFPRTSENSRWLGVRITNMNSTTAFNGPFYVDDEGGAVPDGIWHITDFETGVENFVDFAWGADVATLAQSSAQKYHGDASLAVSFSLPSDTTGHAINVGHALTPYFNLLPYVGMRSYLYLPNPPPPTSWVQMFATIGVDWSWRSDNQPGIQQGWNELVMDISTCVNVGRPSFSRIHIDRPAIQIGKNTTAVWTDTVYLDDLQAVPAIQASISTVQISVTNTKDLSPYIELGLPFGPLASSHYNWTSSNTTVVSVGSTSGIILGVNPGTATINAADRTGMTASIVVNVIATEAPIAIEPKDTVIQKREQFSPLFE